MNGRRLLPASGTEMVRVFSKVGLVIERKRGSHIILSRGVCNVYNYFA